MASRPLGRGSCIGQHSFTEDYAISLGTRHTGLCGATFGDCTPPSEEVGRVTIQILFHHSNTPAGNRFSSLWFWSGAGEY